MLIPYVHVHVDAHVHIMMVSHWSSCACWDLCSCSYRDSCSCWCWCWCSCCVIARRYMMTKTKQENGKSHHRFRSYMWLALLMWRKSFLKHMWVYSCHRVSACVCVTLEEACLRACSIASYEMNIITWLNKHWHAKWKTWYNKCDWLGLIDWLMMACCVTKRHSRWRFWELPKQSVTWTNGCGCGCGRGRLGMGMGMHMLLWTVPRMPRMWLWLWLWLWLW